MMSWVAVGSHSIELFGARSYSIVYLQLRGCAGLAVVLLEQLLVEQHWPGPRCLKRPTWIVCTWAALGSRVESTF